MKQNYKVGDFVKMYTSSKEFQITELKNLYVNVVDIDGYDESYLLTNIKEKLNIKDFTYKKNIVQNIILSIICAVLGVCIGWIISKL